MAAKFFALERGGVAGTERLPARLAADIGLDADLLAPSDPEPTKDFGLPARTAGHSRARFVAAWSRS